MRLNTPVTDTEYVLGEHQYLISQTDLDSHIVYANPTFVEVSGFDWGELASAPHNMIRHPDMPPEAFADFWETIRAGRTWTGIVKNRRKNGDFYWVHATVMPIIQNGEAVGYASVRRAATATEKDQAARVYARMREGRPPRVHLASGEIREHSLRARLARLTDVSFGFQLGLMAAVGILGLLATALLGAYGAHHLSELASAHTGLTPSDVPSGTETAAGPIHDRMLWGLGIMVCIFSLALVGWAVRLNRHITRPLGEALTLSRQIAAGNLTAKIEANQTDEVGRVMSSLNVMRYSLINIVKDVKRGMEVVTPATSSIAEGNRKLADRTEAQAAALEQTSSSMEELTATVASGEQNARAASELADQASHTATRGGEQIGDLVETMRQIRESSEQINTIVSVIDDIAFQTNLLALNASVEAARAGEHGRGFAVVAGEVRALSESTKQSAQQIKQLIQSSRERINTGGTEVDQTRETMGEVVQSIQRASQLMHDVSTAASEQRAGIEQVGVAITQMDEMRQQNVALVDESAASARALNEQAQDLEKSAAIFRTRNEKLDVSNMTAPSPAS
ncbi:PAS domain-containing methyl-accepting chemotaxis protein [Salinisphaera sp. Q1T1-3]|uniref:methyl-accepting chemotaxis protein n=1 Tax=Salinisphaera sp. Q1T1-3 TaxID=2321229 RepID=UPI0013142B4D|nr:PAS domain-containing methyl-accepting chemotaxis protein [Salinisphaera sp. Q1T1-3]